MINYTMKGVERNIKKQAQSEGIAQATNFTMYMLSNIVALELHDKLNLEADDINRFLDRCSNQIECIVSGAVNLKDIAAVVKELGVIIE